MKNLIDFTVLFSVLIFGVCIGFIISDDINRDNNRIKELSSLVIEKQRDNLKTELKSLKTFHRYGIFIGDTTLHYTTNLKIQDKDYKYLHVNRIKKGENKYYFVLRENVGVSLTINKY